MDNKIKVQKDLEYTLHPSRSRRLSITVHPDGRVVVSVPKHAKPHDVERFVAAKSKWVTEKLRKFKRRREFLHMQGAKFREELSRKYGPLSELILAQGLMTSIKNPHAQKDIQKNTNSNTPKNTTAERRRHYQAHTAKALSLVESRIAYWSDYYVGLSSEAAHAPRHPTGRITAHIAAHTKAPVFSYKKIRIKDQKTRWGSCSRHKDGTANLNFNWRIALLPPLLADYIIVHELCHLVEMNHGQRFWKLVEVGVPGFAELRGDLRKMGKLGVG